MKTMRVILCIFCLLAAGCAAAGEITPSASPASPAAAPNPTPTTPPDPLEDLKGLPLEQFFAESYALLQQRDPDMQLYFPDCYPAAHTRFSEPSAAYLEETSRLAEEVLALLRGYSRAELTGSQRFSYYAYTVYLQGLAGSRAFINYDYPLNGYGNWDLANRFVDVMLTLPLANRADAQAYIDHLVLSADWAGQVLLRLRRAEQSGVIAPRFLLENAMRQIEGHTGLQENGSHDLAAVQLFTHFDARLAEMEGLEDSERQALLASAVVEIERTFTPAFNLLRDELARLSALAPDEPGLGRTPQGAAYYDHLLRRYTGTTLSADGLHELGLGRVAELQAEMRQAAVALGYPAETSLEELNQALDEHASLLEGDALLAEYQRLLEAAIASAPGSFDLLPAGDVVITVDPAGPVPGYYLISAADGSLPGQMVANLANPADSTLYNERSLLHHETIPGHHLQLALAQELDLPAFRSLRCSDMYLKDIEFQGYSEGWAVYAQQLGWEMGLYEGDGWQNLGRLRLMLHQAARMVVDTGMHAKGWSLEQAAEWFGAATGRPARAAQMERYSALPGQAMGYNFGVLTILRLRREAQAQLGERFDLGAFHAAILGAGPVPPGMLEVVVAEWVAEVQAERSETSSIRAAGGTPA